MKGYAIKGIYMGDTCLEESDILDDTVYLSEKKAKTELQNKVYYCKDYSDYIISEVNIV